MIVYTVTVIDLIGDSVLGNRSTPVIYTSLSKAISAVRNNEDDIADNGLYQYAVIEETILNKIRPDTAMEIKKIWFKYNTVLDEFEECDAETIPENIYRLSGFGIG